MKSHKKIYKCIFIQHKNKCNDNYSNYMVGICDILAPSYLYYKLNWPILGIFMNLKKERRRKKWEKE